MIAGYMTEERLQEIARLCDAATPEPWIWDGREGAIVAPSHTTTEDHGDGPVEVVTKIVETDSGYYPPNDQDRAFIVAARTAVPELLAEVAQLRGELAARLRGEIGRAIAGGGPVCPEGEPDLGRVAHVLADLVVACLRCKRAVDARRDFGERSHGDDPLSIPTEEFGEKTEEMDRAINRARREVDEAIAAVRASFVVVDRGGSPAGGSAAEASSTSSAAASADWMDRRGQSNGDDRDRVSFSVVCFPRFVVPLVRRDAEHASMTVGIDSDERGTAVQINGVSEAPPLLTPDEADALAEELRTAAEVARRTSPAEAAGCGDQSVVVPVADEVEAQQDGVSISASARVPEGEILSTTTPDVDRRVICSDRVISAASEGDARASWVVNDVVSSQSFSDDALSEGRRKSSAIVCEVEHKRARVQIADSWRLTSDDLPPAAVHDLRLATAHRNCGEIAYLDLLRQILAFGERRDDRTGVGTLSLFGAQIRFDLRDGFPLLTTKKVNFQPVVRELLWFLRGSTNVRDGLTQHTKIWDAWADSDGWLGPIYGHQWRNWGGPRTWGPVDPGDHALDGSEIAPRGWSVGGGSGGHHAGGVDQIAQAIETLKTNPSSRRIIVSAWNVADVPKMRLPPCHLLFQFYAHDGHLDCQLYQRSADMALGVPFNIASYALLTSMVARECGLIPRYFVHTFGDAHVYLNHVDGIKTQLDRAPLPSCRLVLADKRVLDQTFEDISVEDYRCHPAIKFDVSV